MTTITEKVLGAYNMESDVELKVRRGNQTLPWLRNSIHISGLPYYQYPICPYRLFLTAKRGQNYEPKDKTPMEEGTKLHQVNDKILRQFRYGVEVGRGITAEEMETKIETILSPEKEESYAMEFPICYKYEGVVFRGRADCLVFKQGNFYKVEEWKFTKNGKVTTCHLIQVQTYAYILRKLLNLDKVLYEVKAWKRSEVDETTLKELLLDYKTLPEPHQSKAFLFNERENPKVEKYFQRAIDLFTGVTDCISYPGYDCFHCDCVMDCDETTEKVNFN